MGITHKRVAAGVAAGLLCTIVIAPEAAAGERVDGTWRTEGYGTVLEITDGHARFYETTEISCLAGETAERVGNGPNGTVRFAGDRLGFTVRAKGNRAVQVFDGSVSHRELRRTSTRPCTAPNGPLGTFDVFWTTYAENYPFFQLKGIDWQAVRDRYRSRVRPDMSDQELFDLLVEMIEPLGDAHTGILAGERFHVGHRPGTTFPSPELEARVRPYVIGNVGELQEFGRGRIGYADLPGGLGYLRLIAFMGYTEDGYAADAAELDRALDVIFDRHPRGLIIDLRINGGGADALGLAVAARLTGHPHFAYAKQTWTGTGFSAPQRSDVRPAKPGFTGPVVLLTSGSQMSAGETFTQALIGRSPAVTRIGEHTQGVFSDTMERSLPNGWKFILPNERFVTRWGQSFDGAGIPPHIRIPVFTEQDFATGKDSALDRAIALLHRG
ncbi:S41 family peptidase [Alloactinosynnema sp. L-07]|uniref:S41 family peptidase n=1 Tax=Alloactinosynnema sp. L-07 TaxID=1653480 RepID=UPI0009EE8B9A|nr:S41 family peptidase [Alloactinosynnema sp. L-07]